MEINLADKPPDFMSVDILSSKAKHRVKSLCDEGLPALEAVEAVMEELDLKYLEVSATIGEYKVTIERYRK